MFDFSIGEIAVIGVVALVVLGPERMPKVARTLGEWIGKAQRYVNEVKNDINREMELAELKKLQEEARSAAQSIQSSVQGFQADLNRAAAELQNPLPTDPATPPAPSDYPFEGAGEQWHSHTFSRRYKPGPSIDELAEEVARLKRQLVLPEGAAGIARRKYAPRARVNRPRIRR
ncbi:MAG TPA: Sec-independent protein translocase protein TatB [Burkholderiaceae bacterium]|nr:Sec-independent protein translocase protein TatB [Burkholderiaceae bacterium]